RKTGELVTFTIVPLEGYDHGADITIQHGDTDFTYTETPYGFRMVIPYTPSEGENVNGIVVLYIHEDGTEELVTESFYSEDDGGLVFFTDHLSKFGVNYLPVTFSDVPADHWASPYVTYLASRNIVSGDNFRPDDPITRGETVTMLTNALSLVNLPDMNFSPYQDVSATSSLANVASWLYFNNLASDITSGDSLKPDQAITREDMALVLGNCATGLGLRLRSRGLDTAYNDSGNIASYAKSAVTTLRAAGVLEMATNYKFNPKTTLNRGEMAQIIANLLSNL
ncbi:MAG: S-layer homology domain-containing protein, partial [Eubacteriales bacterium]